MCQIGIRFLTLVCMKILILSFLIGTGLMMHNHGQGVFLPHSYPGAPAIFTFVGSLLAYDVSLLIPLLTPGHGIESISRLNCFFNVLVAHIIFVYVLMLIADSPHDIDLSSANKTITTPRPTVQEDPILWYLGIKLSTIQMFKILSLAVIAAMIVEFSICICAWLSTNEEQLEKRGIVVTVPIKHQERPHDSFQQFDSTAKEPLVSFESVATHGRQDLDGDLEELFETRDIITSMSSDIQLRESSSIRINTEHVD